jgi:hypothetical protein
MRKANTGGPLNHIVAKYGLNAPNKTVPVMKLIREHNPKSYGELRELIAIHSKTECPCKIKSHGSVQDFGMKLYQTQQRAGEKFSLEECVRWMDDLFVLNSLRGETKEQEAIKLLSAALPEFRFYRTNGYIDEKLRIDIEVKIPSTCQTHPGEITVYGIQVKPITFLRKPGELMYHKKVWEEKWKLPAGFLFYGEDDKGAFTNLDEIVQEIKQTTTSNK